MGNGGIWGGQAFNDGTRLGAVNTLIKSEMSFVEEFGKTETIASGRAVIAQGTVLDRIYLILDGRFLVENKGEVEGIAGPGCFLGEFSFFSGEGADSTLTAMEEAVVISFSSDDIRQETKTAYSKWLQVLGLFAAQRMRYGRGHKPLRGTKFEAIEEFNSLVVSIVSK